MTLSDDVEFGVDDTYQHAASSAAVEGCHGVIEEQENEDYYDNRNDANDDIEKGRFPAS